MQVTYQKRDGTIMQRYRNTSLPYKIGDITSMGWKVLSIEYEYNGKFYSEHNYNMLIYEKHKKYVRQKQIKELCIKEAKALLHYCIMIIILYYILIRLGI